MQEALKFMYDIYVGNLIDLLDDFKPIDCKWLFKTNRASKGALSGLKPGMLPKLSPNENELLSVVSFLLYLTNYGFFF